MISLSTPQLGTGFSDEELEAHYQRLQVRSQRPGSGVPAAHFPTASWGEGVRFTPILSSVTQGLIMVTRVVPAWTLWGLPGLWS